MAGLCTLATFVVLRALPEPSHGGAREADAEQRERGGFGNRRGGGVQRYDRPLAVVNVKSP